MTERQIEIHKGLKAIGPEIAQFYLDGLAILKSDLGAKSNLVAHLMREIDGGLRDIFEQKQLKKKINDQLKNDDLERLFNQFKEDYKNFDFLSNTTFEDFKSEKGHISSVLASFGFDIDYPLVARYIKVVRWLAKYAHRSGAFNEPRSPQDIINLWREFEEVLFKLIGNYYGLADRIDLLLSLEEPSPEILKTLPNLLKIESRSQYFFNGLKSRRWLIHLENEGYFDGSKNPAPIESEDKPGLFSMPYWVVLPYLENVAEENLKSPENSSTESIVRIVDNICQFRGRDGQRTENYRTDYAIIKVICMLPEQYLDERHFSFIGDCLQSNWHGLIGSGFHHLLERLISIGNKDLLLRGVQLLLGHRIREDSFEKVHSILQSYEFERILSDFKERLILLLGKDILNLALEKINEIIDVDPSAFISFSIPAIEDHEQTFFPDKYDCQLVYLVRDVLERLDSKEIYPVLEDLISSEHPILRRLAIHAIRVRFDEFGEIFWKLDQNPLGIPYAKHEVYELLKQHSSTFSSEEIQKIVDWINTLEYFVPEEFVENEEVVAKSIAYRKKEWLGSLLSSGSETVKRLMSELDTINDAEVEHPGFDSWLSSHTGSISPLTMEDILKLNIKETIGFYFDFIRKQEHSFMGPSVDGLVDTFVEAVRSNPNKYNCECNQLLEAPSQILYAWIRGLGESWRDDGQEFECEEIFLLVRKILREESFWDSYKVEGKYYQWFISSLLSYIEDGVRDDNHAFDVSLLPIIKEILFIILENDTCSVWEYPDLSMTVLNNSKGKIYLALFQYSLRLARSEERESDRWDNNVKEIITEKIESGQENPLLFHVIGQFLPYIHYLDEKWMIEYFDKLFPINSEVNWAASLSGYFYFHKRPNRVYFKLFIEGGHFQKALASESINDEALKGVIQQVCVGYLCDFEFADIDSEIVDLLIRSKNYNAWSSTINFFWNPKSSFDERMVNKIKPFWIKVFKSASRLENEEVDKYVLSGCCNWLNSLDEIDEEIFEIVMNSVQYVAQCDRYSIIQSLFKHIINYTEEVGLILIELLKKEVGADMSYEKQKEMVETLFEKGYKDIGNRICLLYGEKGYRFLREIYSKFNI